MKKLWKVRVNNWGWDSPRTIYKESRRECEIIAKKYPASDPVQYTGCWTDENARILLGR